ncbi:MAG: UDP-2,3-diacylglucosamine diphosphatase [Verrucomicrobia bacterium TMED71]|uniref:UDP-2,3-diacylglucosamine diphosphatase n=1 Tax=Candidatus Pelagisphaera phototrophica TaxID=2684113 RepID=UPI000B718925|nr:UDP-2,3-diacylglucosamine diphosphatase [Candidatus Pelagisphaera phototrophica]QXD31780.1 UDP-2,3-diacylglucosamine diphosphatase [Candidatus Pelagisphaera phototrophica]RPF78545.1 MAG: UDP-2,3-diacylglucosamine diphosphatase [Verrucomicrobia bacterium TMED71]
MKRAPRIYKTIFISDLHLGTENSKVKEVMHFLRNTRCERLVLNGDIIDGWQLNRGSLWTSEHTKFLRFILKRIEKKTLDVIYLRGNHDDILGRFLPMQFGSLSIVEDFVHESKSGRYLVLHGDVFDTITKNFVFLAHLGDWGYKFLMSLNRWYNKYRAWRGKEYYSLSKAIKAKVKAAVNFVSSFEEKITKLARAKECTGVICGHIHTPDNKKIGGLHYLNSGDWVESLSAIVEHSNGRMQLVYFRDFVSDYPMKQDTADLESKNTDELDLSQIGIFASR